MSKINFVTLAFEINNASGGILALHKLAHLLGNFEENSYITVPTYADSSAKYLPYEEVLKLDFNKTMFIYPEVIVGNPYNAPNVTRWVLNTPGVMGGDGVFNDSDLIYKYWNYFKAPDESKVLGELRCFDLKLNQFTNKNFPRTGECFLIKKGSRMKEIINQHSPDALSLDNYVNDEYLSYVFNLKEKFISYDVMTYHSIQAALCGCISVVIPDPGVSKKEWMDKCPLNKYGVAYGLEDVNWAKSTLSLVRNHLLNLEQESFTLIKNYISKCYSYIK